MNNQIVTILGTRYRAERWGNLFEFALVGEMGKDYGMRKFTEDYVYQGVREGKVKIIY